MLTIEEIREKCQGMKFSYIAEQTRINYHTVRYALAIDSNPSYDTVKRLSDWLESRDK